MTKIKASRTDGRCIVKEKGWKRKKEKMRERERERKRKRKERDERGVAKKLKKTRHAKVSHERVIAETDSASEREKGMSMDEYKWSKVSYFLAEIDIDIPNPKEYAKNDIQFSIGFLNNDDLRNIIRVLIGVSKMRQKQNDDLRGIIRVLIQENCQRIRCSPRENWVQENSPRVLIHENCQRIRSSPMDNIA